jgi:O-antigen ligase
MNSMTPLPSVRFGFYAFIFSIPIETLDVGLEAGAISLSGLLGYAFIALAFLQPSLTFGSLPRPLWYFAAYLLVFVFVGTLGIADVPAYSSIFIKRFLTVTQMLVLFWISYNLFKHSQLIKGALLAFCAGCVVLSVMVIAGIGTTVVAQGRVSAIGQDANTLASVLTIGVLALLGLTYGRNSQDVKIGWLTWVGFSILSAGIVMTGSRGAFVSLVVGIMALAVRPGHVTLRLKLVFVAVFAIAVLILAVSENPAVQARWERTFSEGNVSGRDRIMPQTWNMVVESPIIGWGPANNIIELGRRLGEGPTDTHNGYLWILTETGLAGAIPYFIGLWICYRLTWRARHGPEGSLPLALLTSLFLINMAITWHYRKMFWVLLAYGAASESFLLKQRTLTSSTGSVDRNKSPSEYVLRRT